VPTYIYKKSSVDLALTDWESCTQW